MRDSRLLWSKKGSRNPDSYRERQGFFMQRTQSAFILQVFSFSSLKSLSQSLPSSPRDSVPLWLTSSLKSLKSLSQSPRLPVTQSPSHPVTQSPSLLVSLVTRHPASFFSTFDNKTIPTLVSIEINPFLTI